MPPALIPSDEEYASEEDSDFVDDGATSTRGYRAESSTDEDSDAEEEPSNRGRGGKKPTKRKRTTLDEGEAEDAGLENSGDEAIVEKGLKNQRKRSRKGQHDDDEGGEGGLIKTRSMRAQEYVLILDCDLRDQLR